MISRNQESREPRRRIPGLDASLAAAAPDPRCPPPTEGPHARRAFRIGGQGPEVRWRRNKDGLKRTIEEAVAIAKRGFAQHRPPAQRFAGLHNESGPNEFIDGRASILNDSTQLLELRLDIGLDTRSTRQKGRADSENRKTATC
jgi:hypothetical protein